MSPDQVTLALAGAAMPRLSQELPFPPELNRCQRCGFVAQQLGNLDRGALVPDQTADGQVVAVLERWQEHDERDQPEGRVIVLCSPCSKRIVDAHPRLYRRLDFGEPFPGAHALCIGCVHRATSEGLACRLATINGGEGLKLGGPQQVRYHACGRGAGGRRTGWWGVHWAGRVERCTKRKETHG